MLVQFLDWEGPLEEGMELNSSVLAWRIPWIEERGSSQRWKESDATEVTYHAHKHSYVLVLNIQKFKPQRKSVSVTQAKLVLQSDEMRERLFKTGNGQLIH